MQYLYKTPTGTTYDLCSDMLSQPHLLIAGTTGSGKSVIINGLICALLYRLPTKSQFVLIDPKKVELREYSDLPHCRGYADEKPLNLLRAVEAEMDKRFSEMQRQRLRLYEGSDIYVFIDELADLMLTDKLHYAPLIQRLSQLARATKIHLVCATQCPLREVIPTPIKVNFDARVGLRTQNRQDSRNILDRNGCELLPRYGQAIYRKPEKTEIVNVPMIEDSERQRLITHWMTDGVTEIHQ